MGKLLISGGTIVNEGREFAGYILVSDGVIEEIGEGGYPREEWFDGQRIDATGKIVMAGVIDAHVHFREPGLTAKGDMATESAAAVAGGVTSVLEMPNTVPVVVTRAELERKFALAEGRMHTNHSFFLGATADNIGEIERYYDEGGRIVKLFMGSSTGGMLVTEGRALAALFDRFGGVVAAHCEDEDMIRAATDLYKRELGDAATAAVHPLVRSAEACYRSTARAIELADRYGARLHVCHVSTERELGLFSSGALYDRGNIAVATKRVTAEACVPHLWFTDVDYARLGNRIKCNPSIKSAADRAALRSAIGSFEGSTAGAVGDYRGRVDTIATDHAPHTAAEKARGYWDAPSGIPSVQFSLVAMMGLVDAGVLTLTELVAKMCHAPAVRFGIVRRGFLRAGYAADIAVIDRAARGADGAAGWTVAPENILSRCGWSPWEGVRFSSRVACTIVGGRVAWDGARVADTAAGRRLDFAK